MISMKLSNPFLKINKKIDKFKLAWIIIRRWNRKKFQRRNIGNSSLRVFVIENENMEHKPFLEIDDRRFVNLIYFDFPLEFNSAQQTTTLCTNTFHSMILLNKN